mgnify:CR=1 FL=1
MTSLTLIIPTKKEAESLPTFLKELEDYNFNKLIVLQEEDTDTQKAIAKIDNIDILVQKNPGYGNALKEGIEATKTEYCCIINADGSMNPKYLESMLDKSASNVLSKAVISTVPAPVIYLPVTLAAVDLNVLSDSTVITLESCIADELISVLLPSSLNAVLGKLPPNVCSLTSLDEESLISILTEPKNAITKQYSRLFELDGIELEFDQDALREVAQIALKKRTGARGLRAILEQTMLDVMYDIPSNEKISKVVVTMLF